MNPKIREWCWQIGSIAAVRLSWGRDELLWKAIKGVSHRIPGIIVAPCFDCEPLGFHLFWVSFLGCGGRRKGGRWCGFEYGEGTIAKRSMFGLQEKARLGVHGYMRGRNRPVVFEAFGFERIFDFVNG